MKEPKMSEQLQMQALMYAKELLAKELAMDEEGPLNIDGPEFVICLPVKGADLKSFVVGSQFPDIEYQFLMNWDSEGLLGDEEAYKELGELVSESTGFDYKLKRFENLGGTYNMYMVFRKP